MKKQKQIFMKFSRGHQIIVYKDVIRGFKYIGVYVKPIQYRGRKEANKSNNDI